MKSSNFYADIIGNNEEQLDFALDLVLEGERIVSFSEEGQWLRFFWNENIGTPTLARTRKTIKQVVKDWLVSATAEELEFEWDGSYAPTGWHLRSGYVLYSHREGEEFNNVPYEVFRIKKVLAHYSK